MAHECDTQSGVVPLGPEEEFHNCVQQCTDGIVRDGMFIRLYRGRQTVQAIEPADLRSLLETIKSTMNAGLAARKRVAEHFDELPFHFDYIDSDFQNALAFFNDSYAFIGITMPLVRELLNTVSVLVRSQRIRAIMGLHDDAAITDPLSAFLFQNVLSFVVTHEFTHHVHGHLQRRKSKSRFFAEFRGDANGGLESQADEADADGYAAYHVLANFLDSPVRATIVKLLKLENTSSASADQSLFLGFVVVACGYLSSGKLIDLERQTIDSLSHPPQVARLDYLMRHAVLWCEANRPELASWMTAEKFRGVMQVVADVLWGLESHRPWTSQTTFLSSDVGKDYFKKLSGLIDAQKAALADRN